METEQQDSKAFFLFFSDFLISIFFFFPSAKLMSNRFYAIYNHHIFGI